MSELVRGRYAYEDYTVKCDDDECNAGDDDDSDGDGVRGHDDVNGDGGGDV